MAIYHATVKTFSRSSRSPGNSGGGGQSAVAAAAYRAGVLLYDERTGTVADYTRKAGVVTSFLVLPSTAPPWMADRSLLWNMAEWSEKRCNATVARELEVALPVELSSEMQGQLVHQIGNFIALRYGVAVDAAIHLPSKEGDERNHHAHLLFTTRAVTRDGFGKKTRILDDRKTGAGEVKVIRQYWADIVNAALAAAKVKTRIDHRSHKDRGIDAPPQIHVGVNATNAQRHGKDLQSFPSLNETTYKIINYPKIDRGATRAQYNAEIIELQKYRQTETLHEKAARLARQIIDLSGDINQLKAQLNNDLLSDDLRAKIRIAIEKVVSKVFLKKHEETEYLKQVKAAKEQARKLHELEDYRTRLIDIQKETVKQVEEEKARKVAERKLYEDIARMTASLNGIPPYTIKLTVSLSAMFDEAAYTGYLRKQSVSEIQNALFSAKPVSTDATAYVRKDVLRVSELLKRGKPMRARETVKRKLSLRFPKHK